MNGPSGSSFDRRTTAVDIALPLVVAIAALAPRLVNLENCEYGNPYYAAAARSMSMDWSNFLFNSFDPGGFISIDKPPVGAWIVALSVRIFGFNSWAIIGPQAVMGAAAASVLCHLMNRRFGLLAALVAGLGLAWSPINVALDRNNMPDTALVLTTLLSAWCLSNSIESGRMRSLLAAFALLGVAFNVKMLAGLLVVPTFVLVYLSFAPFSAATRILRLAVAALALVGVGASWMVGVDATPPEVRPYVGGSVNNTVRDLVLGYNGVSRMAGVAAFQFPKADSNTPSGVGAPPSGMPSGAPFAMPGGGFGPPPGMRMPGMGMPGMGPGGMAAAFGGQPGPTRLLQPELATQALWLAPFSLLGLAMIRSNKVSRRADAFLWTGWFATHAVLFSMARGIMHPYYLTMLAPAGAAMTGMAARAAVDGLTRCDIRGTFAVFLVLATAFWQVDLSAAHRPLSQYLTPVVWTATGILLAVSAMLWRASVAGRAAAWPTSFLLCAALFVLHVAPTVWSAGAAFGKGIAMMPSADPSSLFASAESGAGGAAVQARQPGGEYSQKLVDFIRSKRRSERYFLVMASAMQAAPYVIRSAEPVIAAGGFLGTDPALSAERLSQMVKAGQVRYALVTDGLPPPPGGATSDLSIEWTEWVRANGKPVQARLWKEQADSTGVDMLMDMIGLGAVLYDCRPDLDAGNGATLKKEAR